MSTPHLKTPIVEVKYTDFPLYAMVKNPYTIRTDEPTNRMVKLEGEKFWRRVMCWGYKNMETYLIWLKGRPFRIHDRDFPTERGSQR